MKKPLALTIYFFLCLACYSQESNSSKTDSSVEKEIRPKDMIGKPYPAFNIASNNKEWSDRSLRGKTVFINFWFVACPPCMAEMPQLNDLYDKFKGDTNFVMLSMTFEPFKKIDSVRAAHKVEYEVFQVSREGCMRLNPAWGFPANIVVDNKGIITYYKTGGFWKDSMITRRFKKKIYPAIETSLNSQ